MKKKLDKNEIMFHYRNICKILTYLEARRTILIQNLLGYQVPASWMYNRVHGVDQIINKWKKAIRNYKNILQLVLIIRTTLKKQNDTREDKAGIQPFFTRMIFL